MSFNILVVEDDKLFLETIEDFLTLQGYVVDGAMNLKEARDNLYFKNYDVMILDVKLPDGNGFDFLKEIREQKDTPTIFLTSKSDGVKEGFLSGGDDYLVKPVDLEELLLRVKALLKRAYGEDFVNIDDYTFDLKRMELKKDNEFIDLNLKELKLLELFIKNRKKSISKEQIFDYLWGVDEIASDGALRVYINRLKKLFGKDSITNIRGYGYRFEK